MTGDRARLDRCRESAEGAGAERGAERAAADDLPQFAVLELLRAGPGEDFPLANRGHVKSRTVRRDGNHLAGSLPLASRVLIAGLGHAARHFGEVVPGRGSPKPGAILSRASRMQYIGWHES